MKKLLTISLFSFIIMLTVSCKKEATDVPVGTIKVSIGGVASTFSVQAKATRLNVNGGYGIQVQGNYRSGSTTNFTFSIVSPNPITAGTYTENAGSNPLVTMTHCIEVLFPCVFQSVAYGSPANPVSITITQISGSSVKGTFKGELLSNTNGGSTSSTEVLTNGEFYVRF